MAMQGFTQKIVMMMKSEKLFESQGGPIILSQVWVLSIKLCTFDLYTDWLHLDILVFVNIISMKSILYIVSYHLSLLIWK